MRFDHLANAVVRSVIPFQAELRRLKRRFRPSEEDPGNTAYCITNGLEQLAALRASGFAVEGSSSGRAGIPSSPCCSIWRAREGWS